jgi:hypothetical protein
LVYVGFVQAFDILPAARSLETILQLCGSNTKILDQILDGSTISQGSILEKVTLFALQSFV